MQAGGEWYVAGCVVAWIYDVVGAGIVIVVVTLASLTFRYISAAFTLSPSTRAAQMQLLKTVCVQVRAISWIIEHTFSCDTVLEYVLQTIPLGLIFGPNVGAFSRLSSSSIQTFIPMVCVMIPYFINLTLPIFGITIPLITDTTGVILSFFPSWDPLAVILLMRPYRLGLWSMIRGRKPEVKGMASNATSAAVTPVTT